MSGLGRLARIQRVPLASRQVGAVGWIALVFVGVLTLAMMRRLPLVGGVHKPAYGLLWLAGVAQDYQLFNWIDRKNYAVRYSVIASHLDGGYDVIEPALLFPRSLRATLLQSYLHDVRWMPLLRRDRPALKRSIVERLAHRFCRLHEPAGQVSAWSHRQRLEPEMLSRQRERRRFVMRFQCAGPEAVLCQTLLDPQATVACGPHASSPPSVSRQP